MPKTSSLRPKRLASRDNREGQWCINVPAELSSTGKRQRLFFCTKLEADVEAELLKTRKINFGHSLCSLSAARIAEASACFELLDMKAPEITLSTAVTEFLAIYRERTASVPIRALFDSFLETKKGAHRNYQRELRNVFERVACLDAVIASSLRADQLDKALAGFPDGNRNAALRYLRAAFNYGIRQGWLPQNPVAKLEFKKLVHDCVEVIPPQTIEKLLVDALANELELLPFLVLAFYAGIRPDGELQKILWSDINLVAKEHHVTIRPTVAKKRRKRWIDLSANALSWLEAYRSRGGRMEGAVVPFSASTLRRKRRRNALAAGLEEWPQQGARHTYCSCWLRQHGDINKLVLQAGHESATTMWNAYYQAVTPANATAFWNIFPPAGESRQIVPFVSGAKWCP